MIVAGLLVMPLSVNAQFKDKKNQDEAPKTEAQLLLEKAESSEAPVVITLEDALKIA